MIESMKTKINWNVFDSGTADQVKAEIAKLPEESGLETRDGWDATPFSRVVSRNSNPEVITVLLKAGAEVNTRYKKGITPLMLAACFNSSGEVITALLKAGAELEARTDDGSTPLMFAAGTQDSSSLEVITTLLKAGAEVNARTDDGSTPLMNAARVNNNAAFITALLKAGANAKAKDEKGKTALDLSKEMKAEWKSRGIHRSRDSVELALVGGGAEHGESSATSNKYQCEKCGEKQHKGIYFGPYSDVEFIDVESGWYDLEEIQEAHSDVTAKIEEGNIYEDKTIAFAKGIDPIAEVQCSSCNEPIPVSLKQTLSDLANTIDRVSPFRGPTLRGRVVSNDHSNMTKGSSLIEGSSCKICNSKLRLTAVIPISVQEVGKESGDLTLGGGFVVGGSNITDDEHMEFTDGSTYSTHQTELDLVYSIQCTNSESVCWYMEYLTGETLEDVLACAMQTEATPVALLPGCRK